MLWLVSYDISSDRRRHKVAKALEGFGRRVQWSVFECRLDPLKLERLLAKLRRLVEPSTDSLRFYRLCGGCEPEVLTLGVSVELAAPIGVSL